MSEQIVYSDAFDTLDTDWRWLRENPDHWRRIDGRLEIRVEPGVADTVSNLHTPTQQYEQVGITWYSGDKPVFKLVKELIGGDVYIIPGKYPIADEPIRLRLTVHSAGWKAEYRAASADALSTAAEGELPAPQDEHVSLQCYNGPEGAEHWMRFEQFVITRIDGAIPT